VHSALEHRYLRDVERPHRLPRGVRQAPARNADGGRTEYRDVLYEAYLVAVELDGRRPTPATGAGRTSTGTTRRRRPG
jgi:hypothetical protein